jgi:hypothetical protein
VLNWLETLTRELPRHERASALPLVGRLRTALHHPLPLGAERQLAAIATGRTDSASLALQSALRIAESCSRGRGAILPLGARVVAIVIVDSYCA